MLVWFEPQLARTPFGGRQRSPGAQGITIDRSAISRSEGRTRYLMDYEIYAIARSLKVSVVWLFGETEDRS